MLSSNLPSKQIQPWKIKVVKANKPIYFVCMSDKWIDLLTHWYGGHTVVCCQTEHCEACKAGTRRDFRAFVGGRVTQTGHVDIISLTATACDQLETYFLSARGLLGLRITLKRVPERDTGMLNVKTHGYLDHPMVLERAHLSAMLVRIFSMNAKEPLGSLDG